MGVLPCYRRGCENIMCYRYSLKYGYICDECFDELVKSGVDTDIEEFMDSEREPYKPIENAYDLFDEEFKMTVK